jgi:hypothetical protein
MANISDLIMQQVKAAVGGVQVPADAQGKLIEGMSSSVLGSLTQTVAKPGGADLIKSLLSGKTSAASSPVTQLAGKLFTSNVLNKLNLGSALNGTLSGLVPQVMGNLSSIIRDRDGDGDVDLNDILLSLKGGSGGGLLGTATGILGGLFKKK